MVKKQRKQSGHRLKRYGFMRVHHVESPELAKIILDDMNGFVRPSFIKDMLNVVVGDSLLALEGDDWRSMRKIMAGLFTPKFIDKNVQKIIQEEASQMAEHWAVCNDLIDVEHEMRILGAKIITRTIFSQSLTPEQAIEFVEAVDVLMQVEKPGIAQYMPKVLGISHKIKFPRLSKKQSDALKTINDMLAPVIQDRINNPTDDDDLLSRLINARDDDGQASLDNKQILDQIVLFAIAGHETVAGLMTFTFQDILKNPEIHQKVEKAAQNNAIYLNRVFLEALRLHTPAPSILREASLSKTFNGVSFKKGDLVFVNFQDMHKNPEHWYNPDVFDPERFENLQDLKPSFIPFSRGPKTCIGRSMTLYEGVTTLKEVFQNLKIEPHEFLTGKTEGMTLRPKGRLLVTAVRKK